MPPGLRKIIPSSSAVAGFLFMAAQVPGQVPHNCAKPLDSEFRVVTVVSRTGGDLAEPVKLDFDMDAEGNVDIYWVERTGRVRKHDAKSGLSSVLGRPDNLFAGDEHGLNGIALDPLFKQNRHLYLFHSVSGVGFRVMRYTLNAAGLMDNATAKVMLEIKGNSKPTDWHTGGAMQFDDQGNLFISVGENRSGEAGPPNTNDLRGKILRIRPKLLPDGAPAPAEGVGRTYDIPEGNLFPPGTDKTRPEIYVMGTRNAYTINYDNRSRRLMWGCVGPDGTGAATEEHNLTDKPGFFGWPYFAGNNHVLTAGKSATAPVNSSASNTGLQQLPPARGSVNSYNQSAAITGPVYRYTNVESKVKLPPHFDGVWFASDFNKASIDTIAPNAALTGRLGYARIWPNLRLDRPTDFKQGPDGALYAINYSGYFSTVSTTAIVRIEYTGTCRPVALDRPPPPAGPDFAVRGWTVSLRRSGNLRVADLAGRTVHASRAAGKTHDLAAALRGRAGIYLVMVDAPTGARARKLALPAP